MLPSSPAQSEPEQTARLDPPVGTVPQGQCRGGAHVPEQLPSRVSISEDRLPPRVHRLLGLAGDSMNFLAGASVGHPVYRFKQNALT